MSRTSDRTIKSPSSIFYLEAASQNNRENYYNFAQEQPLTQQRPTDLLNASDLQ